MKELRVDCSIYMEMRDVETEEEVTERMISILDSELCNLADHHISYQVYKTVVVFG